MKNQYDPKKHHRRSIRLKDYDYSQEGMYFVTICVQNKLCLFGHISGKMILNEAGKMVENQWLKIKKHFPNTELHEYIIMPNHFHAIIEIVGAIPCGCPVHRQKNGLPIHRQEKCDCKIQTKEKEGQPQGIAPTIAPTIVPKGKRLGDMIGAFKSIVTVEYIRGMKKYKWKKFYKKLFQRNYYEHIIRNQNSFFNVASYISKNPEKWEKDKFYQS